MRARTAFSGSPLLMLAALAVLIGLGVWQLQRLQWKEGLIAEIETRTKARPVTLEEAIAKAREGDDPSYFRVRVEGRFHHAKELYLYAVSERRGRLACDHAARDGRRRHRAGRSRLRAGRAEGPGRAAAGSDRADVAAVTGIVRMPRAQGTFTPDNEPRANRWFWRDLARHGCAGFRQKSQVAPFLLEAERGEVPGGWPRRRPDAARIPNNHLQYALTWFLMAVCLVVDLRRLRPQPVTRRRTKQVLLRGGRRS